MQPFLPQNATRANANHNISIQNTCSSRAFTSGRQATIKALHHALKI